MDLVARHECLKTDDYLCELDEYRDAGGKQFLLAHIRVFNWAPSVCKKLVREWKLFRTICTAPIYGCPQVDDERWAKFVALLGFRPLTHVLCNDGAERPLFIHIIGE